MLSPCASFSEKMTPISRHILVKSQFKTDFGFKNILNNFSFESNSNIHHYHIIMMYDGIIGVDLYATDNTIPYRITVRYDTTSSIKTCTIISIANLTVRRMKGREITRQDYNYVKNCVV